jgi:hypothetical protein
LNSVGGGEMEVEVETVVEETDRRWHGSSLQRWYAGDEARFAVEKGLL